MSRFLNDLCNSEPEKLEHSGQVCSKMKKNIVLPNHVYFWITIYVSFTYEHWNGHQKVRLSCKMMRALSKISFCFSHSLWWTSMVLIGPKTIKSFFNPNRAKCVTETGYHGWQVCSLSLVGLGHQSQGKERSHQWLVGWSMAIYWVKVERKFLSSWAKFMLNFQNEGKI